MKANELRIGNLIKWISSGDIEVVEDIDTTKRYHNVNHVNISDAVGIELTEEWLLKSGFKYWDKDVNRKDGKTERFFILKWYPKGEE